ncbi:uncharacterized protein ACA1_156740 [Acanthamoeba castellanii str. Neff]|uniref:Uncharacterized protein n=1 Tax=Acanthamoeba castellanii (strain ATCC 30010 / Neff) TaxID=1257118 RepID=L8GK31_ACACF|nr:uncharacterized protein ACA1_156740 [Acanthamoeba castellanii str. Neff]ELR12541.1 hypothetical protein ACA1_156740 [Acanthamoeba castellanii str. Neff]
MDTTAYKDGLRGWLRAVDAEDLSFSGKPAAHGIAVEGDAVVAKDKGNDWFKKRDYGKAVECLTL